MKNQEKYYRFPVAACKVPLHMDDKTDLFIYNNFGQWYNEYYKILSTPWYKYFNVHMEHGTMNNHVIFADIVFNKEVAFRNNDEISKRHVFIRYIVTRIAETPNESSDDDDNLKGLALNSLKRTCIHYSNKLGYNTINPNTMTIRFLSVMHYLIFTISNCQPCLEDVIYRRV